jgi:PAS domain S-box-containing protein
VGVEYSSVSRELVQDIIERTGDVAYRYRLWPTQGYEYISETVLDLLGYSPQELLADPRLPSKLVHPEDYEQMRGALEAPAGQEVDLDLRWIRRDGSVVRTDVRCVVMRDATGRAIRVDGVARDVTHRDPERQSRLELIQARARASETSQSTDVARVVIADDHELTRAALRAVLGQDARLELVGEARDGREAIALVRRLQPDLVLMDLRMPDVDGLQATRTIKEANPMTSVLILTMFEDSTLLLEAVKAGAAGYVVKSAPEVQLRTAIWEALGGELPVDAHLARDILRRLASEQPRRPTTPVPGDPLSPREREVLVLLARGQTNREIGEELVIAANTVKIHVEHILAKFGVSDRTQAAVRAIELGYISAST